MRYKHCVCEEAKTLYCKAAGCRLQGCRQGCRQKVAHCNAASSRLRGCRPQGCKAKVPYLAACCCQNRYLHFLLWHHKIATHPTCFLNGCIFEEAKTLYCSNLSPKIGTHPSRQNLQQAKPKIFSKKQRSKSDQVL